MRGVSAGLLVLALASLAADKAPAGLDGTWRLVSISANGEERRTFDDNTPRLVVKGD